MRLWFLGDEIVFVELGMVATWFYFCFEGINFFKVVKIEMNIDNIEPDAEL